MDVLRSGSDDVYRNLAVEDLLLSAGSDAGPVLFFCVNAPAVVVGKNQNPWQECRVERLAREGVALARRASGGGAVYHDAGNLNYSLCTPRAAYAPEAVHAAVRRALARCGVPAVRMGRTSLGAEGLKLSGTAFALRGGRALFHGTLLVGSDLARLRRMLEPPAAAFASRAVPSVPSPVANLRRFAPGLERGALEEALAAEIGAVAGGTVRDGPGPPAAEIEARAAALRTAAWVWDRTPPFAVGAGGDAAEGVTLEVVEGRVARVAGPGAPASALSTALAGARFEPAALAERAAAAARGGLSGRDAASLRRVAGWLASAWA
jgi:lipoate-protein ligase A